MLRSKWLYVSGLAFVTPIVLALCAIAVEQFMSSDVTVSWGSGGKYPPSATASTDIYLVALIAVCVWFGSVYRVMQMFRADKSGD